MSGTTNVETLRKAVLQLAKHMRNSCDKILDYSIPFVIDSGLLWIVCEEINALMSNSPCPQEVTTEDSMYHDFVMFLSDFFDQTPSLSIMLSSESDVNSLPGDMDLTFFRNLKSLELRKIPPHMVCGLSSIKSNLRRLKCSRCLDSPTEILIDSSTRVGAGLNLTCVWPELKEIDFSFNRISTICPAVTACFELTPSIEILNLSRNKISSIDDSFSKMSQSLSVLNLNYNQLTTFPLVPPNLKVLLLAHNYITSLTPPSFIVSGGSCSVLSLKNLELLDLSTNMISDENDLTALKKLSSLKNLTLIGNPISYLDNYRSTVCINISRLALNRTFILDKKKLSNSEIRMALEQIKLPRFVPFIPSTHSQSSSLMSDSTVTASSSMSTSSRFGQIKSLTQSYDSSSSSVRSSCRKKPKIREVVVFDPEDSEVSSSSAPAALLEDDIEVLRPSSSLKYNTKHQRKLSSSSSDTSEKSDIAVIETRQAIVSLREKYGEENWLFRQAGCEVGKLLGLPERPSVNVLLSRSLPTTSYFESVMTGTTKTEKLSDAELLILSKGTKESTNAETPNSEVQEKSSESSDGQIFYSCLTGDTISEAEFFTAENNTVMDGTQDEDCIFPVDGSTTPEVFCDSENQAERFRIYSSGECFELAILNNFLYEIDPGKDAVILVKWDLRSLQLLNEKQFNSETETVEFQLIFDTLRKTQRERTFVMGSKEFSNFNKVMYPFIEERTLQEFADSFQCLKCKAQFSRGMVNKIVKQGAKGQPIREVPICPNMDCGSDLLVPLEAIPLPNDELLNVAEDLEFGTDGPICSSTPVSGYLTHAMQLPRFKEPKPKVSTATFLSMLKPKSNNNNPELNVSASNPECGTTTQPSSGRSSSTVLNNKSDSDIEVLSCDSSSIEVIDKNENDSGSDIEVQEAVEIDVHDENTSREESKTVVIMTESTSSGSFADSICTTYERKPTHIVGSASHMSSSVSTSMNSYTSSSTLTTNSPSRSVSVPIRYDYKNFGRIDHRLQLFCEISVFKSHEERLVALVKALIFTDNLSFTGILIFSNIKIYVFKVVGVEGDKPQDWLQRVNTIDISKLIKLDVLIGRHGVGLDFTNKYYAMVLRDTRRTSNFIEYFMSDICAVMSLPPMVRDFSQTQKALMCPTSPLSYFGILRFVAYDSDKSYSVCAIVLTDEEVLLVPDLSWLGGRTESVSATHSRELKSLRQAECLEEDPTFVRLIFEEDTNSFLFWELSFETECERDSFVAILKSQAKDTPFISLSQPLDP